MAFERRRRLSSDSDRSSTSTNYSTESTKCSPTFRMMPIDDHRLIKSHSLKRSSTMSSPAELLLARTKNSFIDLNPFFQCSSLPSHWRKNKSLRFLIQTKPPMTIKTNTRVVLLAGNDFNPSPPMKNNISYFRAGQAEFNDLRFLGASGRGKKFTLTVIIESDPPQQCTYRRAIKITVDGPRKKRESKMKSDVHHDRVDESNTDGESDVERKLPTNPSSGLLLLAAVAEQKRLDEQSNDRQYHSISIPMDINCSSSSSCLSPTSSLVSRFSHSIDFSPNCRANLPTTNNLLLSLNYYQHHHHPPRSTDDEREQHLVQSNSTSSSKATQNTHVLCR